MRVKGTEREGEGLRNADEGGEREGGDDEEVVPTCGWVHIDTLCLFSCGLEFGLHFYRSSRFHFIFFALRVYPRVLNLHSAQCCTRVQPFTSHVHPRYHSTQTVETIEFY